MSHLSAVISSRQEFHAALRAVFAQAAATGCHELWLSDADFADWPLGERAVVESLTQWAGPRRRLTLFAASFDAVSRQHARWVEWRRHWSHGVRCFTDPSLEPMQVPTLLFAPSVASVRLVDRQRFRGTVSQDATDGRRCRSLIDALMQQSVDAFPVTTTGL